LKDSAWTISTGRRYPGSRLRGIPLDGPNLGAMHRRIDLGVTARVDVVKAFRDGISPLPLEELRNRRGVKLASGHPEPTRREFRHAEKIVGERYSSLHGVRITEIMTAASRQDDYPAL
jgi:hypothetical protein